MNPSIKKIALVTDDRSTISAHFGRAQYYEVVTIENGGITHRETRDKMGHHSFAGEQHEHHETSQGHGFGAGAERRHTLMLEAIKDCDVLVARGMGAGAYEHLRAAGILPILTEIASIDDAVRAYIDGRLTDHPERLH
jgi:predicted Fe-Mo cluster-binding NifX family protein